MHKIMKQSNYRSLVMSNLRFIKKYLIPKTLIQWVENREEKCIVTRFKNLMYDFLFIFTLIKYFFQKQNFANDEMEKFPHMCVHLCAGKKMYQ